MIVCDSLRFVMVLPPKTGSTSMRRFLVDRLDVLEIGNPAEYVVDQAPQDYTHVLTVRNPFPRAVSHWWAIKTIPPKPDAGSLRHEMYAAAKSMTFAQFCRHAYRKPLLQPCRTQAGQMPRVDCVLQFESFCHIPGFPAENRAGSGGYGQWHDHYDQGGYREICARYRDDFLRYGYSRAAFRDDLESIE